LEVLSRPLGTGETVSNKNTKKKLNILSIRSVKISSLRKYEDVVVTYPEANHSVMCYEDKRSGSSNVPSSLCVKVLEKYYKILVSLPRFEWAISPEMLLAWPSSIFPHEVLSAYLTRPNNLLIHLHFNSPNMRSR